jgi:hypothetical protein
MDHPYFAFSIFAGYALCGLFVPFIYKKGVKIIHRFSVDGATSKI